MGNNQSPVAENQLSPTTNDSKKKNIFADTVPTSFMWPYGGRKVYLIGSFNEWREKIPLTYSPELEQFGVVLNMPQGRHFYRFVVDGSQKADPKQPLVKDSTGQRTPTNYIDVIKKIAKSTTSATKSTELDIPNTASRNPSLKKPVGKGSSGSKTDDNETTDSSGEKSSNASSAAHPVKKHVRTLSKPSDTEEGSTGDFSELIAPEQQPTKSQAQKIRKIDDDNNFSSNSNTPNSGISSNSTAIRNKTKHERMPSNNSENNPEEEEEEEERESLEEETSLLTPKQHWINDIAARDYTQEERVFVETKKTMPIVPPHLKYTPLNSSKKYSHDTCLLPVPLHVTVNHAYMKKAPDMQVFGITQRFQGKYSTLVFFKPNNENNPPS